MRAAVAAGSSTSGKFLAVPAIRFHIPKQQPAKGGSSRPQEGAAKGGPHQKNLISRSKGSNSRSEGGRSKRSPQRSSSSGGRQAGGQAEAERDRVQRPRQTQTAPGISQPIYRPGFPMERACKDLCKSQQDHNGQRSVSQAGEHSR